MKMVEVKTAELAGPALDWAVAQVESKSFSHIDDSGILYVAGQGGCDAWSPSTAWSQGGPLIEKYDIHIAAPARILTYFKWHAQTKNVHCEDLSLLVAVCRAIVSEKIGEYVKVPAELV